MSSLTKSIRSFGNSLLSSLRAANPDQSIVISPLSTFLALLIAANGANDQTLQDFIRSLNLSNIDVNSAKKPSVLDEINKQIHSLLIQLHESNDNIKIANSLWVKEDYPVKETFRKIVKEAFDGEASNFKTTSGAKDINEWVSAKTAKKINNLLETLESDIEIVIVNAIYFKDLFQHQFQESQTGRHPFHLNNGTTVEAQLMHQKRKWMYCETAEYQAVDLPYTNGFAARFVLPTRGTKTNPQLVEQISVLSVNKFRSVTVDLFVPKFRIEWQSSLKSALKDVGLAHSFSDSAEFFEMTSHPSGLKIGDVVHKTFVEVDEKGTEAAAATAVKMMMRCAVIEAPPVIMRVDRPFYFSIHNPQSDLVLFAGFIDSV